MPPLTETVVLQPLIAVGEDAETGGKPRRPQRRSYARIQDAIEVPKLIETQIDSFDWFKRVGLRELFDEISPIEDFTGKNLALSLSRLQVREPRYDEFECRERDMTYAAPLKVKARLLIKATGEVKESEIFMGDFPLMTENGTFIINGAERVVVSQLIRSPGVYFKDEHDPTTGRALHTAKLIPNRGAWLEFETTKRDVVSVKVDRKRKMPVTILLRAVMGLFAVLGGRPQSELDQVGHDEDVLALFADVDTNADHRYHRLDAREGQHAPRQGGADRAVQAPAPGRPADAGQRAHAARIAAVQPAPLRPGAGRALQAEPQPVGEDASATREPRPRGRAC